MVVLLCGFIKVLRLRQVVSGMETPRSVDALEVEVTEVAMGDSEEAAHDLVLEGVAASPMVELVFLHAEDELAWVELGAVGRQVGNAEACRLCDGRQLVVDGVGIVDLGVLLRCR